MPDPTDDVRGRLLQRAEAAVPDDLTRKVADAIRGCITSPEVGEDELEDAARAAVVAHQLYAVDRVLRDVARQSALPVEQVEQAAGDVVRATSPGVPRCTGEVWTTSTDQITRCSLPLGHHGGCR